MLQALGSDTANEARRQGSSIFSNATFSSGSTPLTMSLIPPMDTNFQNGTFLFVFDPRGVKETDHLFFQIQNASVTYDLAQHTYEFRFDNGRNPEMVDLDFMIDDPKNPDSLAFPNLPYRLHSISNHGWTSSNPTLQPWADFRQYMTHPWVLLLKTETDYPPGYYGCSVVRMCGMHSLDAMLKDGDKLESALVPVGRFLIELAKFGLEFCLV
jgi:hypothetical protein